MNYGIMSGEEEIATRRHVGRVLAELRVSAGVSQKLLSERLDTSRPAISRIECRQHDVALMTVIRYLSAIGVSMSEFAKKLDEFLDGMEKE